ncbi:MAG: thioredoxin family protein [Bradyrhizobium sp.]
MQRRLFLAAMAAMPFVIQLATPGANAAERKTFDAASFAAAQQQGARILVDISATWCPTCKAQKPIIDSLVGQPKNSDLVIFAVDFDSQKPIVRQFGAQSQSTLIAFKGRTETGRSVGDTDPDSIAALVPSNQTK